MPAKTSSDSSPSYIYPAIVSFSVAAATLILQLVQTRIYSFIFWNHLVYFIISIALLGFGISGTWLAFGSKTWLARKLTLRNAAIGFFITAAVSTLIVPQWGGSTQVISAGSPRFLLMLLTYGAAVLPYFFGGWMLGSIFRDYAERIHFLYFADLVGAGLGCLFYLFAMPTIGAIHLTTVSGLIVAAPPLLKSRREPASIAGMLLIIAAVLGTTLGAGRLEQGLRAEPTKALRQLYADLGEDDEVVSELTEWNAISRIDVVSRKQQPAEKRVFIDGDAWTPIMTGSPNPARPYDRNTQAMIGPQSPYYFFPDGVGSVLVIGSGGGHDVQAALRGGATHVDAVEINPTTARIMQEEYDDTVNQLFTRQGVQTFNEEGRSFVSRSDRQYDVVVLHAIDTFAALSSGAYVLSENYLYTVEAVTDYLSHLTGDGIMCITRWTYSGETPRLFGVCMEAMHALGYEDPARHIHVHDYNQGLATILVRARPFTEDEIAQYTAHTQSHDAITVYPAPPGASMNESQTMLADYAAARRANIHDEFLAAQPINIAPVYDDSPFFFHFERFRDLFDVFGAQDSRSLIRGNWPTFTLFMLLALTILASVVFMIVPLIKLGPAAVPGFSRWLVYFSCLGVSFIFVEIALMQRFALLLGHPSRSLALVLAGLLFFSGVGSQLQGRFRPNLIVCLISAAALIVVAAFVYPSIVHAALGAPLAARGLLTIALVAPIGMLLGMPFPSGIERVSQSDRKAVPWMWGVNGGTTVVGSVLAIVCAIWMDFTAVLLIAAAGYTLAALITWSLRDARPAS